jgi:RNA recognition motif-containing protein
VDSQDLNKFDINKCRTVFVAGIPKNMTRPQVISYFKPFGKVIEVEFQLSKNVNKIKHTNNRNLHRGSAKVKFNTPQEAKNAINYENHKIEGKNIIVRYYLPDNIRRQQEKSAINERRKVHIAGVPKGYSKGKISI